MNEEVKRLTKLVTLYREALTEISQQEEMKDLDGEWVPTVEMEIAINALEEGKKVENTSKERN